MGDKYEFLSVLVNQIGAILIALITAASALIPYLLRARLRAGRERRKAKKERRSFQHEMEFALRFSRELRLLRDNVESFRAVLWRRENGQYFGGSVPASVFVHFQEDMAPDAPGLRHEQPRNWPAAQLADVWLKMTDPENEGVYCVRKLTEETIASGSVRFLMKSLQGIHKVAFGLVQNEFGNPIGILTTSWRRHEKMPPDAKVREEMKKAAKAIAHQFSQYNSAERRSQDPKNSQGGTL